MDAIEDLFEKLTKRTIDYLKNDLGLTQINDEYEVKDVETLEFLDVSVLIALSGDINGTISLSVSDSLSKQLIESFVFGKIKDSQIKELAGENVAETLNIVVGNILPVLNISKQGGNVEISPPYIMRNKVSVTKKKNGKMLLSKIECDNESILLGYFNLKG